MRGGADSELNEGSLSLIPRLTEFISHTWALRRELLQGPPEQGRDGRWTDGQTAAAALHNVTHVLVCKHLQEHVSVKLKSGCLEPLPRACEGEERGAGGPGRERRKGGGGRETGDSYRKQSCLLQEKLILEFTDGLQVHAKCCSLASYVAYTHLHMQDSPASGSTEDLRTRTYGVGFNIGHLQRTGGN